MRTLVTMGLVAVGAVLLMAEAGAQASKVTKENVPGITNLARLETTIACAGAVKAEAVPEIKKMGFASIINVREASEPGAEVAFTDVLLTALGGDVQVGKPTISGVRVTAQVVKQGRAKKILVFKKKRRKNYRRRQGHRQYLTTVRVTGIDLGAGSHGA